MSTGELIKDYRLEKGLTQKVLGNLCGIDEAQIRKYESGRVVPKIPALTKIANGLGIPLLSLLPNDIDDIDVNVLVLSAKQRDHVKKQLLIRIVNVLENLQFDKLDNVCECLAFLSPDEIHGHLLNARNASMNGHTPEDVGEWLMHQDPKK